MFIGGCASLGENSHLRWGNDWYAGTLTEIGDGAELAAKFALDCHSQTEAQAMPKQFATVAYMRHRSLHWRTVALPDNSTWKVGDSVLVNVHGCNQALEAHQQ